MRLRERGAKRTDKPFAVFRFDFYFSLAAAVAYGYARADEYASRKNEPTADP